MHSFISAYLYLQSCRGASEFTSHFCGQTPEQCRHVTGCDWQCTLLTFPLECVSTAVLGSALVLRHFRDTQHFSSRFTLSTHSLLSAGKLQMWASLLLHFDAFHARSFLRNMLFKASIITSCIIYHITFGQTCRGICSSPQLYVLLVSERQRVVLIPNKLPSRSRLQL